jgi:2-aminoadipate transaminase
MQKSNKTIFDFAVGQTNPETFPVEAFKAAAIRAIDSEHETFNKYHGLKGHEGLRSLMAARESEREGVTVDPELIALTNGSMQAVTLVGQALMQARGDIVITEEFTYSGTISAYKGIGLEMVGIPMDEDGMRVDLLAIKLKALAAEDRLPRFIYTLTTYQNPTGTCMPVSRKRDLIEIARQYNLPLVEDNCYGDVHFDGEVIPSMFAMDDGLNHIYIGSLSKIFAPGVRLGYLHAREPLFTHIVSKRFDAGSNYFAASVLAEFYRSGIHEHALATTPPLKIKRDLLLKALSETLEDICVWSKPAGGLFLWLRLPEDTDLEKLNRISNERNFYFANGSDFHVDRQHKPYIRLAFGHVPDHLIEEGIPVLARSIREARTSNESRDFDSLF